MLGSNVFEDTLHGGGSTSKGKNTDPAVSHGALGSNPSSATQELGYQCSYFISLCLSLLLRQTQVILRTSSQSCCKD